MTKFMAFGLCAIVLGLMDFLWLSYATPRFYAPLMGDLLRDDIKALPAIIFYLVYAFGLSHFAANPEARISKVAANGALIGLIGYGTYNLSALAVIAGWSTKLAIIDMVWGAFVSAVCAIITSKILQNNKQGA